MPGLIRGVARTAVVAGTASAVGGRVHHRQQQKWAAQDADAQQEDQQEAQQEDDTAPSPAGDEDPMISKLKQLAELHDQGILTDEEFAAQKAKVLGS